MERAIIHIAGRVQGVGFRSYVIHRARPKKLCGYVQNLPDGRVRVEVEGERTAIEALIEELKRGPGRVSELHVIWREFRGEYQDFSVRY